MVDIKITCAQKENGMYCLSKLQIEQLATDVLRETVPTNLEMPTPLDTGTFLQEHLGLRVLRRYIGGYGDKILGLTVMGDEAEIPSLDPLTYQPMVLTECCGTVLISPCLSGPENRPRRRYTEVHEGSHWLVHQPYFERCQQNGHRTGAYVACRTVERFSQGRTSNTDWAEWQADHLAAALLMPQDIFRDYAGTQVRRAGAAHGYLREGERRDRGIFYEVIDDISERFLVSKRAAQIRMIHTGIIKQRKN